MRLGLVGYYSGFILYPAIAGVVPLVVMNETSNAHRFGWLVVCVIGVIGWTIAEYFIHRYVLHHVPYFHAMHEVHHEEQEALVGTPFWMSSLFFLVGAFLPASWLIGPYYASAVTVGLMVGYFWYTLVHHAVHHWHLPHDSYLYRLKRRHAMHHYTDEAGNFGVTSNFWDRVFGTYVGGRTPVAARR